MLSFKEFTKNHKSGKQLNEMSFPGDGDWSKIAVSFFPRTAMDTKCEFVSDIKIPKLNRSFHLYRTKGSDLVTYRFGEWDKNDEFASIASFTLEKVPDFLYYKNVWNSNYELVSDLYQYNGIAKELFIFLSEKLKITILGDSIQYFGSRKLWSKLSKIPHVIVDIVDIKHNKVIEHDVEIYHGLENEHWDERVWFKDESEEKMSIRVIMKIKE